MSSMRFVKNIVFMYRLPIVHVLIYIICILCRLSVIIKKQEILVLKRV